MTGRKPKVIARGPLSSIEIQGLDWSVEFEGTIGDEQGPMRLSVDCVFDLWPPRDVQVRLSRDGDLDRTHAYRSAETLSKLQSAVEHYLEKPGCNMRSRATAFARLRHALTESDK